MVGFWIESIKDLLVAIAGTSIAIYGAIWLFKREESGKIRRIHFKALKSEILEPWRAKLLSDIKTNRSRLLTKTDLIVRSDFEQKNEHLFKDAFKHFPKLKRLSDELEKNIDELDKELNLLCGSLREKYHLERVNRAIVEFLIDPLKPENKMTISDNWLMSQQYHFADGRPDKIIALKEELHVLSGSAVSEKLKSFDQNIKRLRNELKSEIDYIISTETLRDRCSLAE